MDYYSSGKVVREKCFIFGRGNLESATILAQSPPKNDHFFLDMQTRQFHPYVQTKILPERRKIYLSNAWFALGVFKSDFSSQVKPQVKSRAQKFCQVKS